MTEYVRVTDTSTGHRLSVQRSQVVEGGPYRELKADAVDSSGDPLPPEFDATKPLSSTTTEGQTATDNSKEK